MKVTTVLCDLCDFDEEAIGAYTAKDGNEYDVCETHLETAKELKLEWRKF